MPILSEGAGEVVARKRSSVLGSYRDAYAKTGISVGTWERIEKGKTFQKDSLWKVAEALGWPPLAAANDLMQGRNPDAPQEAQDLFPKFYEEQEIADGLKLLTALESWPRPLLKELGSHGRYLTDVEKEDLVADARRIAEPRRREARARKLLLTDENFASAADTGHAPEPPTRTRKRPSPEPNE